MYFCWQKPIFFQTKVAAFEAQIAGQEADIEAVKTDVMTLQAAQAANDAKILSIETMVTGLSMAIAGQVWSPKDSSAL